MFTNREICDIIKLGMEGGKMAKNVKKSTKGTACKVCNHAHLVEIETALLIDGKPSREVEQMIKDKGWEPVSYVTLLTHMKEHVDAKRELVLKYLDEKRKILQGELTIEEDPEKDEMAVRLNELRRLDRSIQEADILVRQASKALQEQLALRVETESEAKGKGKQSNVVGTDRKPADKKKAYVPLQTALVGLYKSASEELRQTVKTKMEVLGIDSEGKKATSMETLVDLILEKAPEKENNNG